MRTVCSVRGSAVAGCELRAEEAFLSLFTSSLFWLTLNCYEELTGKTFEIISKSFPSQVSTIQPDLTIMAAYFTLHHKQQLKDIDK